MTDSTVAVLTPAGVGAIAVIELRGPHAWAAARVRFQPAGPRPLPQVPEPGWFCFGTLGQGDGPGDEVVLSVKHRDKVEIHCHGGRRVVRWLVEAFLTDGFTEVLAVPPADVAELLTRAPTLRTAAILLDQSQGAFRRAVETILADLDGNRATLERLAALAPLGRHLVEPWRVAVAGPPNVGKSSLMNALAGYDRSIVAPVAGTTRDVVTAALAFDGWPVTVSDTAGLRDGADALEAAGIARAEAELRRADLILWVLDLSEAFPVGPPADLPRERVIVVGNKSDIAAGASTLPVDVAISARNGTAVPELIAAVVGRLVPIVPKPLEAVPYSTELAHAVESACAFLRAGSVEAARTSLASCLAGET